MSKFTKRPTAILACYKSGDIKITVEEVSEKKFITTFWNINDCFEVDRDVYEFVSFGGAMAQAFQLLCNFYDNEWEEGL